LPENHRVVIVMKFFEDMSYQEIGETLCIPLGTVKSRMHEGIKRLREIFSNKSNDQNTKQNKSSTRAFPSSVQGESLPRTRFGDKGEGK
jgi:hypothetical protein